MKTPGKKKATSPSEESRPGRKRPAHVFFGVLTSISPTKLVIKGRTGKEASMNLHEEIESTCDGVSCDCQTLKPGQRIRVITQKKDLTMATQIASLDKKSEFTPEL